MALPQPVAAMILELAPVRRAHLDTPPIAAAGILVKTSLIMH